MRCVIINADDFGLSEGVNRGIEEVYRAGSLSSATLMVNMPGFEDAVRTAYALPGLGVGLHFNVTYGKPLSDPRLVPSLVKPDGAFRDIKTQWHRDEREIEHELAAQWERFIATGLRPTHLDSHHHMHQIDPSVYRAMAALAVSERIPMRKSQLPTDPSVPAPETTDAIVLDTYDQKDGINRLMRYIHALPHGTTEIMCHPGYADDTVRQISEMTIMREQELNVFRSPDIRRTIDALGVRLIHYGQLANSAAAQVALEPFPFPAMNAYLPYKKQRTKTKLIMVSRRRKKKAPMTAKKRRFIIASKQKRLQRKK